MSFGKGFGEGIGIAFGMLLGAVLVLLLLFGLGYFLLKTGIAQDVGKDVLKRAVGLG